jgi:hypothetical protein
MVNAATIVSTIMVGAITIARRVVIGPSTGRSLDYLYCTENAVPVIAHPER